MNCFPEKAEHQKPEHFEDVGVLCLWQTIPDSTTSASVFRTLEVQRPVDFDYSTPCGNMART